MYGTGSNEDLDFATVRNLLEASEYCGYDALKETTLELLTKHITLDNVCEEMVNFKIRKCEAGFQFCKDLLNKRDVFSLELELPFESHVMLSPDQPPLKFDCTIQPRFSREDIIIQGVGLTIGAGSNLKVSMTLKETAVALAKDQLVNKEAVTKVTKQLSNQGTGRMEVPNYFPKDKEITLAGNIFRNQCTFSVEISGNGIIYVEEKEVLSKWMKYSYMFY